MGLFVRAIVYGFGFSLGAALYKRVSDQLGIDKAAEPGAQPQRTAPPPADTGDGNAQVDALA